MPLVSSGQFAYVYKLVDDANKTAFAVRCFRGFLAGRVDRYRVLAEHVRNNPGLPLAGFSFDPNGIALNSAKYPILVMDWVPGVTLDQYITAVIREGKGQQYLSGLADRWIRLVEDLRQGNVAHGDLQHGNIMVLSNGDFKLVDFDGMFVPALKGKPPGEIGHRDYQHPQRSASDFTPDLDRFSALVIYLCLRSLSEKPSLWDRFHDESLLFKRGDFAQPSSSKLFSEIMDISTCRDLGQSLQEACLAPPNRCPLLSDMVKVVAPPIPKPKLPMWMQDGPVNLDPIPIKTRESSSPAVSPVQGPIIRPSNPPAPVIQPLPVPITSVPPPSLPSHWPPPPPPRNWGTPLALVGAVVAVAAYGTSSAPTAVLALTCGLLGWVLAKRAGGRLVLATLVSFSALAVLLIQVPSVFTPMESGTTPPEAAEGQQAVRMNDARARAAAALERGDVDGAAAMIGEGEKLGGDWGGERRRLGEIRAAGDIRQRELQAASQQALRLNEARTRVAAALKRGDADGAEAAIGEAVKLGGDWGRERRRLGEIRAARDIRQQQSQAAAAVSEGRLEDAAKLIREGKSAGGDWSAQEAALVAARKGRAAELVSQAGQAGSLDQKLSQLERAYLDDPATVGPSLKAVAQSKVGQLRRAGDAAGADSLLERLRARYPGLGL